MNFNEIDKVLNEEVLNEGLKHLKYSDVLLKMAGKIKPKNKESSDIKQLALQAAKEFRDLEKSYSKASKSERVTIKEKYKNTKKKYSTLIKKINIKRALIGTGSVLGAVLLTVAGILIGERVAFTHYLKEFNASLEPLRMHDDLVDIDANINRYGSAEGLWDDEKKELRVDVTARGDGRSDYRKVFARDDNDTNGMKANKIRNVIMNYQLDFSTPEGKLVGQEYYDVLWKEFRAMEKEVDDLIKDSKIDTDRFDKAWDKLSNCRIMRRFGLTKEFKKEWSEVEKLMKSEDFKTSLDATKRYREMITKVKGLGNSGGLKTKAATAFDNTFAKDTFDRNMNFIKDVTHMDVNDYLDSVR